MNFRLNPVLVAGLVLAGMASPALAENWPGWRGPRGDGTSLETNTPVRWSATSNVLWSVEVPGVGHASPIVWNDRVFIASALPEKEERVLLCFDRTAGRLLWQRTVLTSSLERKHGLNSHASGTPATDGERVYAAFLDRDQMFVAAYDLEGKRIWEARPGPFSSVHGFCSSPVLHKNLVIVNGDHDGESYLTALDRATGRTVWKTRRQNKVRSYCTPLIRELAGSTQLVLSGDKCVASYDPDTGTQKWVIDGPTDQFVASLVYSDRTGLLFVTGGFPDHHTLAIRPDGSGNVTQTHIAWRTTEGVAYVPSPICEQDYFLVVSDSGVAHCFEAVSGKLLWKERFGEEHASLVSAGGLVYFLNDRGVTHVVRPGATFEQVAQNEIGEKCFASPAISQGCLFIRGEKHLFRIGEREKP